MKTELNSLDIKFLVEELDKTLKNGVFRKIYQYENYLSFEIWVPEKGQFSLVVNDGKIYTTKYKKELEKPQSFAMFLRKRLKGQRIESIEQHDFDRIIKIKNSDSILLVELFAGGNVVFCDKNYKIIKPLTTKTWIFRALKPNIEYKYPLEVISFPKNIDVFKENLKKSKKEIIRLLAKDFSFGPEFAEECCLVSGVNKNEMGNSLNETKIKNLYLTVKDLYNKKLNPRIVFDKGVPVSVIPFEMKIYKNLESKNFEDFSGALDEYFTGIDIKNLWEEKEKSTKEKLEKVKKMEEEQNRTVKKWVKIADTSKRTADLIYNYYDVVQDILNTIHKLRKENSSWNEIKDKIKKSAERSYVKEINERDSKLILTIDKQDVEIDIRKSVQENASGYYENSKLARKKVEKIMNAIKNEKIKEDMLRKLQTKEVSKPEIREKKKWYENFRWFVNEREFLIVGGKDAETNETLIKRHTEKNDIAFHADIKGAPFVIVKTKNEEVDEDTKKQAAQFAACYSKAWPMKMNAVDVYAVKPEQLSKEPPSGEFLAKGAFMVYGKRMWFKNAELKLKIGLIDKKLCALPNISNKNLEKYITVVPGEKNANKIAEIIKNKWGTEINPNDLEKLIPSGKCDILE